MASNSGQFQSINVNTNGVTRLFIPCTGYSTSSASQNPIGAFDLPSSQAIFVTAIPCSTVVQQSTATAAVSFLPKPATSTMAENSYASTRPAVTLNITRPTSPLSSIRFSMASRFPNKTVLAVRPKPSTLQGVMKPGMTTLACTSTQGTPGVQTAGIGTSVPLVKVIQARPSRPGTVSQAGKGISVITATKVLPNFSPPVFQSPLPNLATTANLNFRAILPARPNVMRQITPTIVQPSTPMITPVRSRKKTVTIRMPGNTNSMGASNMRMTQTKYAIVEMMEGGKKVMRCIQLNSVDDGPCKRVVPETTDEPEQAENQVTEDLKVIEIVPDEEGEEDIPEPPESALANDGVKKDQEPTRDAATPPSSWSGQAGVAQETAQETVHASPSSSHGGSRPGIFETLKSMTVEEASAAVAALTVPKTLASDPKYNIVHRGDDHFVIENPGYSDEGEDDDATLSCDEEHGLDINEPHTLSHAPEPDPSMDALEAPREISVAASPSKNKSPGKCKKNVAKRTGGRPHVASKNTSKRTGGRPLTTVERYGVDIKECHVSLEKLYNTKPTVRWVHRHMLHILCCYKGQPGMRLKRLRKGKAMKLAPPNGDESSEIPRHRKTRDRSKSLPERNQQTVKTRNQRDKDSSLDVDDTTDDIDDASDMTRAPAELLGEQEPESEPATEDLVRTVNETTVASEEKQVESSNTDRSRKRKRAVAGKNDVVEQTEQETPLVPDAKPTEEKAKTAGAKKRKSGPTRSGTLSPARTSPTTTGTDFEAPASKPLQEMHQITSKRDSTQLQSVTGLLQGHPSSVSGAESSVSTTGAGRTTQTASLRVTLAASTLGMKLSGTSTSISGASSIVATGARSIVSASEAVQKLMERSPSCSASQLGAGHFIATGPDGKTLLIRRTVTPEMSKAEFASPAKGKYYLVKTEQKAYLVPVDKLQLQQAPNSERLVLVPTATTAGGAVDSPATANRRSPLSQTGRSEGNAKTVVSTACNASGSGSANAQSKSSHPGSDYEPAVADMRQEDRISLLKEKLRLQQEKLEKMRKKKVD